MKPKPTASNPTGDKKRQFPVFESIGQCAAALGCPEELIKTAKRKGCVAFMTGSRVDSQVLIPFLFQMLHQGSDLPPGISSWKEFKEKESGLREAIKRQVDEKAVMPTDEARRQAAFMAGRFFSALETFEREWPPAVAGADAVKVFERMHTDVEALRKQLQEEFNNFGK